MGEAANTRLNQWLEAQGFRDQGVLTDGYSTSYLRPEGQEGNVWFGPDQYASLTDPAIRKWIEWLFGRLGYGAAAPYPGAAAA